MNNYYHCTWGFSFLVIFVVIYVFLLKCFLKNSEPVNMLIILKLKFNFLDKIETGWRTQICGKTSWMVAWEILHESLFLKPPEPGRRGWLAGIGYHILISYISRNSSFVNMLKGPKWINNGKTKGQTALGIFGPLT